ncbi:MAG: hypothetical protein MJZ86_06155 [Bacteroidales bacterium]|nr:hypothetical protein [Bacteroidales bacterium]
MKTVRNKSLLKVIALAILTAGCLISCDQSTQNTGSASELQGRLDEIMKEYQEMQASCDDYTTQLAQRDSSIQAQAAEIQSLINQLNNAGATNTNGQVSGTTRTRTVTKTNNAKVKKLTAQLEAKKNEIANLQSRLDQLTQELADLRSVDGAVDREALARLQRLVKEQDARIVALTNDKVRLTNTNDSLTAHVAYLLGQRVAETQAAPTNTDYAAQVALLQNEVAAQKSEIARLQEDLAKQVALVAEANENAKKANAAAEKTTAESKAAIAKTKGNINKKLAQLQNQCDEYFEELQRLRAENVVLRAENDSLRNEVVSYKRNAENTAVENAKMAAKVSRASILATDGLTVTPLKRLSNGTGRPTTRATAVSAFRIEGTILANNVIEPGTITIYSVLTSPSNVVLHNGSMEQKFDANGIRSTYTTVQSYEFTGDTRTFEMNWSKDDETELEAGIYRLSLFANSSLIGVTEFKLK